MQNLDYQQPSEKDIVQSEDISNVPAEKCLENVGFEFDKYVDVGLWPKSPNKQLKERLRKDAEYYHNVLERVVAIVKYLAIRGLAFRGTEEGFGSPHNGNFMGALELLAEFDPFIQILETNGLLLDNGRGQSFDNAANMSGRYNDVQAVPKEKNKFANYVPCTAHSLNLVGAE
ncbi:zinc finger MYM-type protein 1 [Trichonephila clavipes]|nr:zinc finger MYM-type protein 1 [Trichonephila clavipes]